MRINLIAATVRAILPVVFWHGMGDTCCDGISNITASLQSWYPGVYVHSISIGENRDADQKAGFFGKINDQIELVCSQLASIKELENGFNAVGFSQGGLFLRGYVQRCNSPKVNNLITFGSPHAGTSDIPNCERQNINCALMRSVVEQGVYWGWVQSKIIQAQYFKKHDDIARYLKSSIFLPEINDEISRNPKYANNLQSLNKLVLIKFSADTMIVPKETSHFGFFDTEKNLVNLKDQKWYQNGGLGLKLMNEQNKIDFLTLEGNHMQFSIEEFKKIADTYLADSILTIQPNRNQFRAN